MAIETMEYTGFHGLKATNEYATRLTTGEWKAGFTYTFYNHFHPYVSELLEELNKRSIEGLLDPNFHESPELDQEFFKALYQPNESDKTVAFGEFPKKRSTSVNTAPTPSTIGSCSFTSR